MLSFSVRYIATMSYAKYIYFIVCAVKVQTFLPAQQQQTLPVHSPTYAYEEVNSSSLQDSSVTGMLFVENFFIGASLSEPHRD